MTGREVRRDEGFTLIELLVSISVLGAIMAAVTAAFVGFLKTGAATSARDDHSAGGALLASYLDRDLASADSYSYSSGPGSCAVTGTASGSPQVRMSWTERRPHSDPKVLGVELGDVHQVTYATTTDGRLVRRLCSAAGNDQTTVLSALPPGTSISSTHSGSCPATGATRVVISIPPYSGDSTDPYQYGGCVRGRLG